MAHSEVKECRKPSSPPFDLAVVMPVYNEAGCIEKVIPEWLTVLEATGARFQVIVLDDGSTDATGTILDRLANATPRLHVVHKPNSGHGPSLVHGYRLAVAQAEWVFQTDSDGEMPAEWFPGFWNQRAAWDALFGHRAGRNQSPLRRLISLSARTFVRLCFGSGPGDANVPFRLMRARFLAPLVRVLPEDYRVPNLALSGLLGRMGARWTEIGVPFRDRTTGVSSIRRLRLLRFALQAAGQTVALGWRLRGRSFQPVENERVVQPQ
ncbi:MAG TPA: glycosyltransferase family 2 protein [Candidatus Sumerlaeota bacterium]|nr:glycosyltransferase family 2 protein [Candidatus Sumerlaeota bacterium]